MKLLGNVLWLVFGGLLIAIEYFIASLILMITIIGIPFGIQTLKLAELALWPFGKNVKTIEVSGLSTFMVDLDSSWRSDKSLARDIGILLGITIGGMPLQNSTSNGIPGIDSIRKDNHPSLVLGTGTARFTTINSKIVTHSEILILPDFLHRIFHLF